jgi:hypothetical protein
MVAPRAVVAAGGGCWQCNRRRSDLIVLLQDKDAIRLAPQPIGMHGDVRIAAWDTVPDSPDGKDSCNLKREPPLDSLWVT